MPKFKKVVDEVRHKHKALTKKADKGSRAAAIRIFCLVCMGGSAYEVKVCTAYDCPMYDFRMGKFIRKKQNGKSEGSTTGVGNQGSDLGGAQKAP